MFPGEREKAFSLIEVLLAISIIIIIYLGATTAQISSEIFLKNIRADFEKHLELNNALDHIVKNVRRSESVAGAGQSLTLRINGQAVVYSQSADTILYNSETIARDAWVNFEVLGRLVSIRISEDITDPDDQKFKKIPITIISKAYARDQ
jgi:Tfp pilus assembly protein PilV